MQLDRNGFLFTIHREALVLVAYPDGEHCSSGFGVNDPKMHVGEPITVERAFKDVGRAVREREASLNQMLKVPVTQNEFNGLFDLHYQSGIRFMRHDLIPLGDDMKPIYPGPYIIDLVNEGKMDEAIIRLIECDTNKAGVHMPGLHKRRVLEQNVMLTGDYGDISEPIPLWHSLPRLPTGKGRPPDGVHVVSEGDLANAGF